MKKDSLEKLFDRLQGSFDTEEPNKGHEQRFLEKLRGFKRGNCHGKEK